MISAQNIHVTFGGLTALEAVDLSLDQGEVVAVIGPNGSGKSTLFNVITGFVAPNQGSVTVDDHDVTTMSPAKRVQLGVARTFQTPRADFEATVLETVLCGFHPVISSGLFAAIVRSPRLRREEVEVRRRADALLERFGLSAHARTPLGELPMGLVRVVEVARAMAHKPRYLLLDEPAAGLTRAEQDLLVGEVKRLAETGIGVLLVEHNFGLVRRASNDLVVINQGTILARGTANEIANDPEVVSAYLGTPAESLEATT